MDHGRSCQLLHILFTLAAAILLSLGSATSSSAQTDFFHIVDDKVGIGTETPQVPLHIKDASDTSVIRLERAGPSRIEFRDTAGGVSWDFRTTSGDTFVITKVGTGVNELKVNSIGDLVIPGSVKAEGGDGSLDGGDTFPDYVFEPGYELSPLEDVARFIADNKHLPGVMSADDVRREGSINMTRLQLQLLQKVEELTLYLIEQQREIGRLQRRVELDNRCLDADAPSASSLPSVQGTPTPHHPRQ